MKSRAAKIRTNNAILWTMFCVFLLVLAVYSIMFLTRHLDDSDPRIIPVERVHNGQKCACTSDGVKVFNLGVGKAGTSTLQSILQQMGCVSAHWGATANITRLKAMGHSTYPGHVGDLMEMAYWDNMPLMYYLSDSYNAVAQMDHLGPQVSPFPQFVRYELLLKQYPNAKFMLWRRNFTTHIDSITRWGSRSQLTKLTVPYLPPGKGDDADLRLWLSDHYERIMTYFNAVAPGQFMTVWIENVSVAQVADFLHCDGNFSLPHANKNVKNSAA